MRKKALLLILLGTFTAFPSLSHAGGFTINDYTFSWKVAEAGHVTLKIVKDPSSTLVALSSMGGRIATIRMTGGQAEAVGKVLAKAEDYYRKYKAKWDKGSSDVVEAGPYRVTFSSNAAAEGFKIKLDQDKMFSPVVHFTKDTALEIAKHLQHAGEMVSYVDKRIKP